MRYSLDPEAFLHRGSDRAVEKRLHEDLIQAAGQFGILAFPRDSVQRQELLAAIDRLDGNLRKRWKEALEKFLRREDVNLPEFRRMTEATLQREMAERVQLCCLEPARAISCCGLAEDDFSGTLPGTRLEICRFDLAARARTFEHARAVASREIPPGIRLDVLWAERFHALVRHSTNVAVLDRYAVGQHVKSPGFSGLSNFLRLVDETPILAGPRIVRIVSERPDPSEIPEAAVLTSLRGLRSALRKGGIRELRLHLCPFGAFKKPGHDRHFRLDTRAVFAIGVGLEIFEGSATGRHTDCAFYSDVSQFRSRQSELVKLAYPEIVL